MDEEVKRIIERFGMKPHPEGGYFREVYRSTVEVQHPKIPGGHRKQRRCSSLIYYLLQEQQFSAFHRVRWTDEIWHLYAGGPLELHVIDDVDRHTTRLLTTDLIESEPTMLVDAGNWQAARLAPGARWAFGGCTVSPGFEYDDFEMPPRQELITSYPQHAAIIRELTMR